MQIFLMPALIFFTEAHSDDASTADDSPVAYFID